MNTPRPTKKQARILFHNPDWGTTEVCESRGRTTKKLRDAINAAKDRFWEVYHPIPSQGSLDSEPPQAETGSTDSASNTSS